MEENKQLFQLYPLDERMQAMKDGEKKVELNVYRLPERGDRVQFGGQWYEVVRYAYEQNKDGSCHYETPVLKPVSMDEDVEDLDSHKIDFWPKAGENEWVTAYYLFPSDVPREISFDRADNSFESGIKLPLGEYLHKMVVRKRSISCVWHSNGHLKGISSTLRFETTKLAADDIATGTPHTKGWAIFLLPNDQGKWMSSFARGGHENDVKDVFVKSKFIDRGALTRVEVPPCGFGMMCEQNEKE